MENSIDNPPPAPSTPTNAAHRCKIRQERWSYETDRDIIVSPTGKRLEIDAHDSAYTEHPLQHLVQGTIERSWDKANPTEPDGPCRNFAVVYLTSGEMEAWRQCWEAVQAHRTERNKAQRDSLRGGWVNYSGNTTGNRRWRRARR